MARSSAIVAKGIIPSTEEKCSTHVSATPIQTGECVTSAWCGFIGHDADRNVDAVDASALIDDGPTSLNDHVFYRSAFASFIAIACVFTVAFVASIDAFKAGSSSHDPDGSATCGSARVFVPGKPAVPAPCRLRLKLTDPKQSCGQRPFRLLTLKEQCCAERE